MCDWERRFFCPENPRLSLVFATQHQHNGAWKVLMFGLPVLLASLKTTWVCECRKGKDFKVFAFTRVGCCPKFHNSCLSRCFKRTHSRCLTESLVNCTTLLHLSFYLYFFKHGYFRSNAAKVTRFGSLDQITNCTRDVPFWKGRGRGGEEWGGTVSYLESGGGCLGVESLSVSLKKFCHEHMEKFFLEMSTTASFHSIRLLHLGVELLYSVTVLPLQNGISWPVFVNSGIVNEIIACNRNHHLILQGCHPDMHEHCRDG